MKPEDYLKTFTFGTLAALGVAAMINIAVDPAHLFRGGRFEVELAEKILAGQTAVVSSDFDERLLQKELIMRRKIAPESVALGSSRLLEMQQPDSERDAFFNHSVSGATLQDQRAIFWLLQQHGFSKGLVWLGVDPWLLNRNNGQTRWKSLSAELEAASGKASSWQLPENVEKWRQAFSLAYLCESLKKIGTRPKALPIAAAQKRPDGALVYGNSETETAEDAKIKALRFLENKPVYSLGGFERLDADLSAQFESFIDKIQRDGYEVELVMTPYHPLVYRSFVQSEAFQQVLAAERFFNELAAKKGIQVRGSYDPARCGCDAGEFHDGMHARRSCLEKIL